MRRKIITIDEEKCIGCGVCVVACHEGAIEIVNGKAKVTREDYCDGLGDCLPACPTRAISLIEREEFDGEQTLPRSKAKQTAPRLCPGSRAKTLRADASVGMQKSAPAVSQLMQWPCQIKLVPTHAPYFENANLLIAADCSAYAYAAFHTDFMRNHITLIGCPKLDEGDYTEKLTAIIAENNIKSIKVVRMEVPCCGGLENAVKCALQSSGKFIPWQVVTVSTDGRILE